ncbi:MAG TPA: DUF881 domain-containing protein [Jatrophihabitans sp.]|jgi:uncharacterized protein YlxW (UPF0749 family)|uniref:DUF881 domain-containing protein n=1 Tax=Jatrophihabitans sp. TaxID=1932789 RepID=UPI002DFA9EA3|nr:DUF881 domain-containing protein [Jatrophihabitans sp.]
MSDPETDTADVDTPDLDPPGAVAPHGKHEAAGAAAPHGRWLTGRHASAAVIGVLTLLLGFAIAVQVRANSSSDTLSGLREDDLIGLLDNQNDRADRLRVQIAQLQDTLRRLQDSGDRSAAARQQAAQEAQALGVLLGTVPARGPGVVVEVTDPARKLTGEDLLDVVEELRGAGAEAIQFGGLRVSTSTSFQGSGGSVTVDGTTVTAPYRVVAIGEARTLNTALNIPGGVGATVRTAGGELTVTERPSVTITVTRPLSTPKYAKPGH